METDSDASLRPLPPPCRQCIQSFSTIQAACDHYFCASCFDGNKHFLSSDGATTTWKFTCPACLHDEYLLEQLPYDPSANVEDIEETGLNVKRIVYICLQDPETKRALCDPDTILVTDNGDLVLVDSSQGEVIWVGKSGEIRKRWTYLKTHEFQGGITIQNDLILLSLRSEKYNSVSYYTIEGKFKFSAFLAEKDSVVPSLAASFDGEIVALDTEGDFMHFIDKEKSVYKSVSVLKPGEFDCDLQGSQIMINSLEKIVVCNVIERTVRSYDKTGVYETEFKYSLHDDVLPVAKVTNEPSDIVVTDKQEARNGVLKTRVETIAQEADGVNRPETETGSGQVAPTLVKETNNDKDASVTPSRNASARSQVNSQTTLQSDQHLVIKVEDATRLRFAVDMFNCVIVADRRRGKVYRYASDGQFIDNLILSVNKDEAGERRWLWDVACPATGELVLLLRKQWGGPEIRCYTYRTPAKLRRLRRKPGGELVNESKCCVLS